MRAAGGITVAAPYRLATLDRADTIVIPGWRDPDEPPPEPLLKKLRAAHRRGARLCSICSGVFVLAAAGVLDGLTVTTHWRYAEKLQARYPALRVNPDALYVDEGQVITSAGSAAGPTCCCISCAAITAARSRTGSRSLVLPPHRDGGQAQFVPRPVAPGGTDRLAKLIDWMRAHAAEPHTLASLAAQAAMSTRTLQRQFADATGMSPLAWLIRERVNVAKDMLEAHPALSLAQVAARAGFGSEESLRRHFRRVAATKPGRVPARDESRRKRTGRLSAVPIPVDVFF